MDHYSQDRPLFPRQTVSEGLLIVLPFTCQGVPIEMINSTPFPISIPYESG